MEEKFDFFGIPTSPSKDANIIKISCNLQHSEWIKCSDRLPEEGKNVILYDGNEAFCGDISLDRDKRICGGMQACDGVCYGWSEKNEITHWMPLPIPPKGT